MEYICKNDIISFEDLGTIILVKTKNGIVPMDHRMFRNMMED